MSHKPFITFLYTAVNVLINARFITNKIILFIWGPKSNGKLRINGVNMKTGVHRSTPPCRQCCTIFVKKQLSIVPQMAFVVTLCY